MAILGVGIVGMLYMNKFAKYRIALIKIFLSLFCRITFQGSSFNVKLFLDSSLSKDLFSEDYSSDFAARPIRFLAPESLLQERLSVAGDLVSRL